LLSGRSITFAGISALIGAPVSAFLGPIIYYVILRGHITWTALRRGILTGAAVAILATTALTVLTLGTLGWTSAVLTPVIAVLVAISVRWESDRVLRQQLLEQKAQVKETG
jgi:hypothetical protein